MNQVKEINIKKLFYEQNLNPENVYYTRNSANSASENGMSWMIDVPRDNDILLPYGQHDITLNLLKQSIDDVGTNPANANWLQATQGVDKISMKEGFPLANATKNINLKINNTDHTLSDVDQWFNELALMMFGNKVKKCNTSGGKYWSLNGLYPSADDLYATGNHLDMPFNVPKYDDNLFDNEQDFIGQMTHSNLDIFNFDDLPNSETAYYNFLEPIIIPPFNPFYLCSYDKSIPKDLWFKKMSKAIPYVNKINYNITFNKLIPSLLFYRFGYHTSAGQVAKITLDSVVSADLLLYWYKMPDKIEIPQSVPLQSWDQDSYKTNIGQLNIFDDGEISSAQFKLSYIPDYLFIYIKRTKDDNYICQSPICRANNDYVVSTETEKNSLDPYLDITSIRIQFGDKYNIINNNFTKEELYQLTMKNINNRDYIYDYSKFIGNYSFFPFELNRAAINNNPPLVQKSDELSGNLSKSIIVLRPYDLGIKNNVGSNNNIYTIRLLDVNYLSKTIFSDQFYGDYSYTLYLTAFYSNQIQTISPDEFKLSQINIK